MVKRADHLVVKKKLTATEKELREARRRIAALSRPPVDPPAPPKPYVFQVPLGSDIWISLRATRPLEERHWNRFYQLLALQRDIDHSPAFERLIRDDVGILEEVN